MVVFRNLSVSGPFQLETGQLLWKTLTPADSPLPKTRCFHRGHQSSGSAYTRRYSTAWQKAISHTHTHTHTRTHCAMQTAHVHTHTHTHIMLCKPHMYIHIHRHTHSVTSQEVLSHSTLVLSSNPVCWNSGPLRLHIGPPPHSQWVGEQHFTDHVIWDSDSCTWWLTFSGQSVSVEKRC